MRIIFALTLLAVALASATILGGTAKADLVLDETGHFSTNHVVYTHNGTKNRETGGLGGSAQTTALTGRVLTGAEWTYSDWEMVFAPIEYTQSFDMIDGLSVKNFTAKFTVDEWSWKIKQPETSALVQYEIGKFRTGGITPGNIEASLMTGEWELRVTGTDRFIGGDYEFQSVAVANGFRGPTAWEDVTYPNESLRGDSQHFTHPGQLFGGEWEGQNWNMRFNHHKTSGGVGFASVPEPSAAMFTLLSTLLVFRRRR